MTGTREMVVKELQRSLTEDAIAVTILSELLCDRLAHPHTTAGDERYFTVQADIHLRFPAPASCGTGA